MNTRNHQLNNFPSQGLQSDLANRGCEDPKAVSKDFGSRRHPTRGASDLPTPETNIPQDDNELNSGFSQNRASSITCPTQNPEEPKDWKLLSTGVDTLYLGLYVEWDVDWYKKRDIIAEKKQQAQNGEALLLDDDPECSVLVYGSGKKPLYRYHIECPCAHVWLTHNPEILKSPNVYVSLSSDWLWQKGIEETYSALQQFIKGLGGRIVRETVSRCDLASDWVLPGGFSYSFLHTHRICRSRSICPFIDGDLLETCYFGNKRSPIQARIYNKNKEIKKSGKTWLYDLWQIDQDKEVWRVEFQVRRTPFKEGGIHSLQDLLNRLGGVWQYLTTEWLSLRKPDNEKAERRTTHPFWQDLQAASKDFGDVSHFKRKAALTSALPENRYLERIARMLPTFAAYRAETTLSSILRRLSGAIHLYWTEDDRSFRQARQKKALQLHRLTGGMSLQERITREDEEWYE